MSASLRHLNALRAFEAAARHQSFAKAAVELNVSHSVVSQHVKNLELWFGTKLFIRHGNRIELSEAGSSLLPRISGGLQTLSDACNDLLRMSQKGTLTISAEPAIASLWLRRHVTEFCAEFPKIDVELRPAWTPSKLGEGHADVIIHFETRLSASRSSRKRLFPIDGYPACSPALRDTLRGESGTIDWRGVPLVHDNGREIWHQWYTAHEPQVSHWRNGRVYSDLSLAIDAAVDGEGVILADDILCAKAIGSGALVALDPRRIRCVWYAMATATRADRKPAVDTFRNWLLAKAQVSENSATR